MNKATKVEAGPLALLRQPFADHHISKLPKETRAQIDARKDNKNLMVWKCEVCGGAHHKDAIHLDYVGHAALTDRLLDTDELWSWEPAGFTPDGLPALDRNGGLWIKLTVCGVTRYGYGAADGKSGGDAVKEMIGDALRNAAMRFGAALDLWHKGDLHPEEEEVNPQTGEPPPKKEKPVKLDGPYTSKTALWGAVKAFVHSVNGMSSNDELLPYLETDDAKALLEQCERDAPGLLRDGLPDVPEYEPLELFIARKKREFEEIENIHETSGAKYVRAG